MLHLSPEIEALVRAKAEADRMTPDELLRRLLAESVAQRGRKQADIERMRAIARRTAALPVVDERSPKEIIDEAWGL